MTRIEAHPEIEADRRADRRTYLVFGFFLFASFVVEAMSDSHEIREAGGAYPNAPWLWQATSHAVIFALTPFITFMLSRFPISADAWRRSVPAHLAAIVLFSVVHILAMVALRKLLSPVVFGAPYDFGLADPAAWLYEFRKDVLTYALIAAIFHMSRLAEQRTLETEAIRDEASQRQRLTLKSGGRTILLDSKSVIRAQAASNYVEVSTAAKTHLARMTLSELERLLDAAGGRHARIHRSHIVNLDHVRQIEPTGEGDVTVTLDTGDVIPGSRRYRGRLEGAA